MFERVFTSYPGGMTPLIRNSLIVTNLNVNRQYTAVVMFTALSSNHQCVICRTLQPIFNDVAAYYHAQYHFNSSKLQTQADEAT